MKLFSTGEAAKIVKLPGSRIRSFVRAGFLSPTRERNTLRFSFQDLLFLKTAKGLLDARVPARTIARMLSSLKRQLPSDRHLATLKIYGDGRRVIAWDGSARWQPDSGQFLFNFDARSMIKDEALRAGRPTRKQTLSARQWFELGVELEATSRGEAERAYEMALSLDPRLADASLNLGRLYHDGGELKRAEAHYRAAAESAPDDPAPRFNLGVVLEDLGRPEESLRAYREATKLDPSFADAYYNLGLLCDSLGRKAEAVVCLRTARKLYLKK
jgi:tetratricopeptide (TPR) repeat protein